MKDLEKLLHERGFLFLSDVYEALGFGKENHNGESEDYHKG